MKPVLTPQRAVELDRDTQARGVAAAALMERAGRAVARAVVDLTGGIYGRRAVVVCGKGNNGGDGLVAARHLARWGMRVSVVSVEVPEELREPAATNARRLSEQGLRAHPFAPRTLERDLARADVAVDAVFGTGFRGVPEDEWAAAIDGINAAGCSVVAVDIPSGVNGATGAVEGEAVRADLTVTFGAAKVGAVLLPGAELAGDVRVVDIGFPDDLLRADVFLTEPADVAATLPTRAVDTHKRASGVLVVVAGSRGMPGAPAMIARAAARMGTGLVVVAVPGSILSVVQGGSTEAVYLALPETAEGTVGSAALEPVLQALERADAVAIGPGLTQAGETSAFVRDLVRASPTPIILDADGLNAFTGRARDLADRKADIVLTPHEGEFARLSGLTTRDLEADRLGAAWELASTSGAVTLLKGSRTIVAAPDGVARVNTTGGPVLATAGSGDVLTGVIGALLARGLDPTDAASSGAYLHGLAGTLAGAELGEGTVAGDVIERLPAARAWVMQR